MEEAADLIDNLLQLFDNSEAYEQISYMSQICNILVLNPEIINIFFQAILSRFNYGTAIKLIIVNFVEASCLMDGALLPNSIQFFIKSFDSSLTTVKSSIIETFSKLYCVAHLTILNDLIPSQMAIPLYRNLYSLKSSIISTKQPFLSELKKPMFLFYRTLIMCSDQASPAGAVFDFDIFNITMVPKQHPIIKPFVITQDRDISFKKIAEIADSGLTYLDFCFAFDSIRVIALSRPQLISECLKIIEILCQNLKTFNPTNLSTASMYVRLHLKLFINKIKNLPHDIIHRCRFIMQDCLRMTTSEINGLLEKDNDPFGENDIELYPQKRKAQPEFQDSYIGLYDLKKPLDDSHKELLESCVRNPKLITKTAVQLTSEYLQGILSPLVVADFVICGLMLLSENAVFDKDDIYTFPPDISHYPNRNKAITVLASQLTEYGFGSGYEKVRTFIETSAKKRKVAPDYLTKKVKPDSENEKLAGMESSADEFQDIFAMIFNKLLKLNYNTSLSPVINKKNNNFITSLLLMNSTRSLQQFTDHAFKNLEYNYELIMVSLYKHSILFPSFGEKLGKNTTDFPQIFYSIFDILISGSPQYDTYAVRYVLESPSLPIDFLTNLEKVCLSNETSSIGFRILNEIISLKTSFSFSSLELVLSLSTSDLVNVKESSINILNGIYSIDCFKEKIEDFSLKTLYSISEISADSPELCFEKVKSRSNLYFNILTQSPHLLPCLFKFYVEMVTNPSYQTFIIQCLTHSDLPLFYESSELISLMNSLDERYSSLLLAYLEILIRKTSISYTVVECIRNIYYSKERNPRFLALILRYMSKTEMIDALFQILTQPEDTVKEILTSIITLSLDDSSQQILSPLELLMNIHRLEDSIDMKYLTKAITICLRFKKVYTQELVTLILQQLVESIPIPTLTMRTIIQSLNHYPKLINFSISLLQKLISKQIWKQSKLWRGFIKCCDMTKPHSFSILLQLPIRQLEDVFQQNPDLHSQLAQHVQNMGTNQRSLIHKAVLQVLEKKLSVAPSVS